MTSDRDKTLEELEGQRWGKPEYDSHLVTECHRLRRVPLRRFSVENLRIMIGQNIGLEHLVPLALERIEQNPFAEGAFYPGDLLVSLLTAEAQFWQAHLNLREQLMTIAERAISLFPEVPEAATDTVAEAINAAFTEFKKQRPTS
jgi:hypothetical protein